MRDKLASAGVASLFMAEVTRILEEGTASHESTQEMTGKIAHAASLTHLSSVDSGEGTHLQRSMYHIIS